MSRAPETPLAIIHRVAATDPHRALLAAVLRLAVSDAIGHDLEAAAWLMSDACVALLDFLVPSTSGMSGAQLQSALLARIPQAVRRIASAQNREIAMQRDAEEQTA
jgi:hypothetical protein